MRGSDTVAGSLFSYPATRAKTARSVAFSAIVAQRYGISAETVRKWQKRGAADCLDRSALPHQRGLLADTGSTLAGPPKLPPA